VILGMLYRLIGGKVNLAHVIPLLILYPQLI